MTAKLSLVIERDDSGYFAYCPVLRGCMSQGATIDETMVNIREAIELWVGTHSDEERSLAVAREIMTASVEVDVA